MSPYAIWEILLVAIALTVGALIGVAIGTYHGQRNATEMCLCAAKCGGVDLGEVKDGACWCREEVK